MTALEYAKFCNDIADELIRQGWGGSYATEAAARITAAVAQSEGGPLFSGPQDV